MGCAPARRSWGSILVGRPNVPRGRPPAPGGSAGVQRDLTIYGPILIFVEERIRNDARNYRGKRERAITAASDHFGKDRRSIQRAIARATQARETARLMTRLVGHPVLNAYRTATTTLQAQIAAMAKQLLIQYDEAEAAGRELSEREKHNLQELSIAEFIRVVRDRAELRELRRPKSEQMS